MGLACAWRLAQAGARVAVFERGAVGREASWAAGGMLAAQCEAAHHPPSGGDLAMHEAMFSLCLQSRALYPQFLAELLAASGREVEFSLNQAQIGDSRTPGILYVCRNEDDPAPAAFAAQKASGHGVEARLFNALPAFWLPQEGQVENRQLVPALKAAAENAGVSLFEHEPILAYEADGESHSLRSANRVALCENVLLCAGSWSAQIENWPRQATPPVAPVKGEVIAVRMTEPPPHVIYSANSYIIPRRDGRVLIGATMELAGFDKQTHPANAQELLRQAAQLWMHWAGTSIQEHWAGLRPGTPDGLPILGKTPIPGLFVASGHFRNGILLTPITAQLLTCCILNGGDVDHHFGIHRFASEPDKREARIGRETELCVSH